jgi:TonB family protein
MKWLTVLLIVILQIPATFHANTTDQPMVVTAVAPVFPPVARTANAGGDVTVEVKVNAEGVVASAKATSNIPLLRASSENAAKRWRFNPSADKTGDRAATLTFTFQILPRCSPPGELTSVFHPPYKIEARIEKPEVTCSDCSPAERERLRCNDE